MVCIRVPGMPYATLAPLTQLAVSRGHVLSLCPPVPNVWVTCIQKRCLIKYISENVIWKVPICDAPVIVDCQWFQTCRTKPTFGSNGNRFSRVHVEEVAQYVFPSQVSAIPHCLRRKLKTLCNKISQSFIRNQYSISLTLIMFPIFLRHPKNENNIFCRLLHAWNPNGKAIGKMLSSNNNLQFTQF